jgi:hypothetical protein
MATQVRRDFSKDKQSEELRLVTLHVIHRTEHTETEHAVTTYPHRNRAWFLVAIICQKHPTADAG